jgi:hypothetical protein
MTDKESIEEKLQKARKAVEGVMSSNAIILPKFYGTDLSSVTPTPLPEIQLGFCYGLVSQTIEFHKINIGRELFDLTKALTPQVHDALVYFSICHELGHIVLRDNIILFPWMNYSGETEKHKEEFLCDGFAVYLMFNCLSLPSEYLSYINLYFYFFKWYESINPVTGDSHPDSLLRKEKINTLLSTQPIKEKQ